MSLQDLFYLVAILYLVVTGLVAVYIGFEIFKLVSFIKIQRENGQELVANVFKTKYAVQIAFLKFVLGFLKGNSGSKNL